MNDHAPMIWRVPVVVLKAMRVHEGDDLNDMVVMQWTMVAGGRGILEPYTE